MNVEQLDSYQASVTSDVVMNYIPKNPQRMEFRNIAATSKSNSSAQISIIPPSNTHLIDRKIYVGVEFTVTAANLKGALRSHVLNSGLIQQSNIVINNGGSFTTQNSDICYGLKRFLSTDHEYTQLYETPTQHDSHHDLTKLPPYQFYNVVTTATAATDGDPGKVLTATRQGGTVLTTNSAYAVDNPASPFIEEAYASTSAYSPHALQGRDVEVSRGLYPYAGSAVARQYTILEPLFSGILSDANESDALCNINRIDINLLFNTDSASRYWSNCLDVASVAINITSVYAVCRFMTPTVDQIPSILKVPFSQYQVYKQDTTGFTGQTCTVNLNNIILGCVPSHFYIFAKNKIGDLKLTDGECFLRMDRLSITVNNSPGLLSSADTRSLYLLSRQNGLRSINYTQWNSTVGSVLCLSDADLGLRGGENIAMNLTLTASFTSFDATLPTTAELVLVTVTNGHVNIGVSSCEPSLGWSQQDEMNMPADEENLVTELAPVAESGSGYNSHRSHAGGKINWKKLWRGVKKFVSGIPRAINTAANVVSGVASFIPHPGAQMLSRGLSMGNTAIQNIDGAVRSALNPPRQQLALPAPPPAVVEGSGMRRRSKGRGLLLG